MPVRRRASRQHADESVLLDDEHARGVAGLREHAQRAAGEAGGHGHPGQRRRVDFRDAVADDCPLIRAGGCEEHGDAHERRRCDRNLIIGFASRSRRELCSRPYPGRTRLIYPGRAAPDSSDPPIAGLSGGTLRAGGEPKVHRPRHPCRERGDRRLEWGYDAELPRCNARNAWADGERRIVTLESASPMHPVDHIAAWLRESGYEVRFRGNGWAECIIAGHGECWHGRGLTQETALSAALAGAFPSGASRALLERALGSFASAPSPDSAAVLDVAVAESELESPRAARHAASAEALDVPGSMPDGLDSVRAHDHAGGTPAAPARPEGADDDRRCPSTPPLPLGRAGSSRWPRRSNSSSCSRRGSMRRSPSWRSPRRSTSGSC